ncbi:hypothetical protein [Arcobacter sp. LA11]|uniref:hypothetical protein n=1 Tax=Arcobacter sp. LA11 TaxID=1898176 RepID=UPI000934A187|nr:hypothetical protein [Arcobacter sp. LA11]
MQNYILEKGFGYKLFMLLAFSIFSSVMYQGHISQQGIYSILFFASLALCAFQIASIFYVLLVKRNIELHINEENISWKIYDNNKLYKENSVKRKDIKEVHTEVNYLTGNIYSSFQVLFKMNNEEEVILTDGLFYDFGLKKAEDVCKFLLNNNLGDTQDIKFAKLTKELDIDLTKEQIFTKKDSKSFFVGVISKNKKEFLSLRLQIESLYPEYKDVQKNANNEFLVNSDTIKNSFIYLRSNAIGYIVEFYNVSRKEDLKTLKQMGKRNKIGF